MTTRKKKRDLASQQVAAGLADAQTIARLHGLTVETVLLWTERGGLREAFPGLYDIEDVAGRIHAAQKENRR